MEVPMRKVVIAGNWKMHKTLRDAEHFVADLEERLPKSDRVKTIVCAPSLFLPTLIKAAEWPHIHIAAQTMHYEEEGAFTGEISPKMLQEIGVEYVIVGHSERREYYNETDEDVNLKTKAAFKHGIIPIICVGESLEQRENNETNVHITKQVEAALEGLTKDQVAKTILAYEPIWAIGTGKTASKEEANEVCAHIRSYLAEKYGTTISEKVIIQYGGSVNPDNIKDLLAESDIDGALVGGASLEVDSFLELVRAGQ